MLPLSWEGYCTLTGSEIPYNMHWQFVPINLTRDGGKVASAHLSAHLGLNRQPSCASCASTTVTCEHSYID